MVNYEFPPLGGGGGVFTNDLAREMVLKGHAVSIITSGYSYLKKYECINGIDIYRVPVLGRSSLNTASMISMLSFLPSAIYKGSRLLLKKKQRYDLIHTHFAVPSGPARSFLSKCFKMPSVLSLYGGDIYDPSKSSSPHNNVLLKNVITFLMNTAHAVIAESNNIHDLAKNIYRPSKKIHIIPLDMQTPSFSTSTRKELLMKNDRFYLISKGRLVKRKGYSFLIKALSLLNKGEKDIGLILIGEGPEKNNLKDLARDLGLDKKIIFAGAVSDEKKFKLLSMSDLYVLSSIHEGFGIVLLEAMHCGLPVIATNEGGQTDIIEDGTNGILVPPRDETALAETIKYIVKNDSLRNTISENNRNKFFEYKISNVADQYLELYRKVITFK